MKKLYFGIGILAVLILASGIYAVNYGQLDSIMSNSAVITDDAISTIGSDVVSEFKSTENTLAEDMITQQNSNILPDKDNEFKYEKYVYYVNEKGKKYFAFEYTDNMTDEERQEMDEACNMWYEENIYGHEYDVYRVPVYTIDEHGNKFDCFGNEIDEIVPILVPNNMNSLIVTPEGLASADSVSYHKDSSVQSNEILNNSGMI